MGSSPYARTRPRSRCSHRVLPTRAERILTKHADEDSAWQLDGDRSCSILQLQALLNSASEAYHRWPNLSSAMVVYTSLLPCIAGMVETTKRRPSLPLAPGMACPRLLHLLPSPSHRVCVGGWDLVELFQDPHLLHLLKKMSRTPSTGGAPAAAAPAAPAGVAIYAL